MNGSGKRMSKGLFRLLLYAVILYLVLGIIPAILIMGMFLGGLLNWIVVLANKGRMPVLVRRKWLKTMPEIDSEHCWMTSKSRLRFLADRFRLSKQGAIFSLGDLILYIASELLSLYIGLVAMAFMFTWLLEYFPR